MESLGAKLRRERKGERAGVVAEIWELGDRDGASLGEGSSAWQRHMSGGR